jgi:hypothetical protein
LFLVLAWLAWRRGRLGIAGGILGGLAGIKLFFGAFLIFFLVRREWRACLLFLVSGLASVTVSVLIAGPDPLFEYLRVLGDVGWYSASWNASILGFVNRVFGEPGNDPLLSMPLFASILGKILTLLAVGLLVFMARRGVGGAREPSLGSKDLAFSSCIVLMLLISPLGWMYYFPFLLIPLAVVWRETRHLTREGWVWFLLVPAWLLSSTPGTLVQFDHLEGDALLILGWSGAYFYALLLLLVILFRVQERALGMARAA